MVDFGGDCVQVVAVYCAIAGDVAEQAVEVVDGECSARELDIEIKVAVGGCCVGVAAQAACAEVEVDGVVDQRDVDVGE